MNFEGQSISLQDALFVDNTTCDLETWRIKSENICRVLVFPPVNNYHRFLVHKVGLGTDMYDNEWICHHSGAFVYMVVISSCLGLRGGVLLRAASNLHNPRKLNFKSWVQISNPFLK